MDELTQRLEFLEYVCRDVPDHENLMAQVSDIDTGLSSLLGSRRPEVQKYAALHDFSPDDRIPFDVKEEAISCRYEDIARMADELENLQALSIPPIELRRKNEEQMQRINKLTAEFDELTMRSVLLTKRLMEQVNSENLKAVE